MKLSRRIVLALVLPFAPLAAQEDAAEKPKTELNEYQKAFLNLPEEKRTEFVKAFGEAQRLFGQKRIFETLEKLAEAEKIFPDSPEILNLRGACQVEFRAFDKAMEHFRKADELQPNESTIVFNIAEVHFVMKNWKEAETVLGRVLELVKDEPKQLQLARLVEFKILLCKLKLGKKDEAIELGAKHDFLDDSPFPYYAEAALHYDAGREIEAEAAIARAARIFQNPGVLAPWQDTMMEYGYIKGFFGGDIEEE